MLEPDRRALLLDALRPPSGMVVDRAVGTTFSLDLEALLMAPVSFALFHSHLSQASDGAMTDRLTLLEAVRRYADRLDIFCQAGQIALPAQYQPILSYLENSVHPAAAPRKHHIFHPKVWVLRFTTPDLAEVQFRLLVLSRNLTFDSSWDTIVQLDGAPTRPRRNLSTQNRPLSNFIRSLPELAKRPTGDRAASIFNLATELLAVEWELPSGFKGLSFRPSGITGYTALLPQDVDRLLVISPFLTQSTVVKLASSSPKTILVSRPESLDRIPLNVLETFERVYQLADGTSEQEEHDDVPPNEASAEGPDVALVGLHAKLLAVNEGSEATIFSGSNNATDAGWGGNVEFHVALTGRRVECGVEVLLGEEATETSLMTLLQEYRRSDPNPVEPTDAENVMLNLEAIGRELSQLALVALIEPDEENYRLVVTSDKSPPHAPGVTIRMWPITLHSETAAVEVPAGQPISSTFPSLSLQATTSFVAFELSAPSEQGPLRIRVVVNARLVGAPEDRYQQILTAQLHSKADVLRYLLLLLSDMQAGPDAVTAILSSVRGDDDSPRLAQLPLFESMVRALSKNPDTLDHIARLIEDLSSTVEGRERLPDGLAEIWAPIWQARQDAKR